LVAAGFSLRQWIGTNMNHNDIRHKLSEYIDETLTPEEQASVEEHLKTCPDCSSALTELRKTVEHVRQIEEVDPPAWMKQKIMARVRTEEEKKQGLFQRIFFPLHIKLPLETIGLLFITVTVYFVARDVQETEHPFPEAPVQMYSTEPKQADKITPREGKAAKPEDSLQRKKEVPQEPGYKALDMKPAYEKPKPPVPAPAPEPMMRAQEQAAPGIMQDQAPARGFSDQESAAQAPATAMAKKKAEGFAPEEKRAATLAEKSGRQSLMLIVSDVDMATARVEDAVKEHGGKILKKEPADGALSLIVPMDVRNRQLFIDKLKTLGELKGMDSREIYTEGTVLEIRIVKQVQQN
jgi:hypothetical protein